jgi:hypothetical protein
VKKAPTKGESKMAKAKAVSTLEKQIFAVVAKKAMTKRELAKQFSEKFKYEAVAKAWANLKSRKVARTVRSKAGRWMLTTVKA